MSSLGARLWQVPALEAGPVVVSSKHEGRSDQLLRWAQQKALAVIAEAERRAAQLLSEARETGFREGQVSARKAADELLERELEQRRQSLVEGLVELEEEHARQQARMVAEFESALGRLALEVGQVLALGELRHGSGRLWETICEAMQALGEPNAAVVRIGDQSQLQALRENAAGRFEVVYDGALSPWDLRVESPSGQAVVSYHERLAEIEKVLVQRLGAAQE